MIGRHCKKTLRVAEGSVLVTFSNGDGSFVVPEKKRKLQRMLFMAPVISDAEDQVFFGRLLYLNINALRNTMMASLFYCIRSPMVVNHASARNGMA